MVAGGRNIISAVGQRFHNSLLVCDGVMRFKREISFCMGGFAIDLICKLTVALSINRHVKKGYFLVCFSFNGELD